MKTNSLRSKAALSLFIILLYPCVPFAENIPLIKKGGVYEIPVEINGVITLNFVLDTGASEVNIPADVALTLYRTGTIRDTDFLPGQTYRLADGSKVNSSRFVLRSLKIGQRRIANVVASIGNISSSLLLGQSFLEKLGAWGIDSQKQVLTIGTRTQKEASSQHPYIPQKIYVPKKIIDWEKLDGIFIKGNKLSYAGYEVEKSLNSAEKKSVATIKKNGETLVSLNSNNESKRALEIGLFPFLGKEVKQLIIQEWTGGASCCSYHKIYELSPNVRLIFDDEMYGTSSAFIVDFDGKGKYDLVRLVYKFRYFHTLCGGCSPHPYALFSYDNKTERYVVSNRIFADYILKDMDEHINKFEDIDTKTNITDYMKKESFENTNYNDWFSQILNIVLNYIYAGKDKQGWDFFNKRYKFSDRDEIRFAIIKKLHEDPVYKEIYSR